MRTEAVVLAGATASTIAFTSLWRYFDQQAQSSGVELDRSADSLTNARGPASKYNDLTDYTKELEQEVKADAEWAVLSDTLDDVSAVLAAVSAIVAVGALIALVTVRRG